jgi:hypothetical protein
VKEDVNRLLGYDKCYRKIICIIDSKRDLEVIRELH